MKFWVAHSLRPSKLFLQFAVIHFNQRRAAVRTGIGHRAAAQILDKIFQFRPIFAMLHFDLIFPQQTFRQCGQFGFCAVRLPDNPAVTKDFQDDAAGGAAQGFYAVAGFEFGGFTQTFDEADHALAVKHAGNVMADHRGNFPFAAGMKVAEQREREFAPDGGESVSVEEKKRCAAVIGAEAVERFAKRQRFAAELLPVCCARRSSFRVNSMLFATSFARSSVDADDSEPVPVFEKSGSGL